MIRTRHAPIIKIIVRLGAGAFVEHMDLWRSDLGNQDAARALQERTGYTMHSCRSRVSAARRILREDRLAEALRAIAKMNPNKAFLAPVMAQRLLEEMNFPTDAPLEARVRWWR